METGIGAYLHVFWHNKRHPYGHDSPQRCLDDTWSFCKYRGAAVLGHNEKHRAWAEWCCKARNWMRHAEFLLFSQKFEHYRQAKTPQKHNRPLQGLKNDIYLQKLTSPKIVHITSIPTRNGAPRDNIFAIWPRCLPPFSCGHQIRGNFGPNQDIPILKRQGKAAK